MAHPIEIIIQASLVEICDSYEIAAAPVAAASQTPPGLGEPGRLTAAMKCACEAFTGRIALSVTEAFAQKASTHQGSLRPADADWVRELTNQLVGRLKIRLSRFGIRLATNLPTTLRFRDGLHDGASASTEQVTYAFRTLKGDVFVTLTGKFNDGAFDYAKVSEATETPDVIIF